MNTGRFRHVFSKRLGALVAVGEFVPSRAKGASRGGGVYGGSAATIFPLRVLGVWIGLALLAVSGPLLAGPNLPTGGNIVGGQGSIGQDGNVMTVQQNTQRLAANWQSFDIGAGHKVVFNQPSSSAVALNRVLGGSRSEIYGSLQANGKVFLINPAGVLFAKGAEVNVGALMASTKAISDADFMAGNYRFTGNSETGEIINQGSLVAMRGGYIVLAANTVRNEAGGMVTADGGTVALAAARDVTLTLNNAGTLGVAVDGTTAQALVTNGGLIGADGGQVLLTARGRDMLQGNVMNLAGVVRARSLGDKQGRITIDGGQATVDNPDAGNVELRGATLDVSGLNAGEKGGTVSITGKNVGLFEGATIDARGDSGGGTVHVGGGWQGGGDLAHASAVVMRSGSAIDVSATGKGDGGEAVLWSGGYTNFLGSIKARGGAQGGDGGRVETSSKNALNADGLVNTGATQGKSGNWLLDPNDITITAAGATSTVANSYLPGTTVTVTNTAVQNALANGNVTMTTTAAGTGGRGDIIVASDGGITYAGTNSLTLNAYRNIRVDGQIDLGGDLNLTAGYGQSTTPLTAATFGAGVQVNANITAKSVTVDTVGSYTRNNGDSTTTTLNNQGSFYQSAGTTITGTGTGTVFTRTNNGVSYLGGRIVAANNGNISFGTGMVTLTSDVTLNAGTGVVSFAGEVESGALSFTDVGNWKYIASSDYVRYLLVAGGGGGGVSSNSNGLGGGGGGGAGGLISGNQGLTAGTTYDVTVGPGGAGGPGVRQGAQGANGGDSSLGSLLVAYGGGGGGGGGPRRGNSGGSGGGGAGASGDYSFSGGGSGIQGQGNDGGSAFFYGGKGTAGGGGGGAGGVGRRGFDGRGGAGLADNITGSNVTYATGGLGAIGSGVGPVGGAAGGAANTGNGGGGSDHVASGEGGSGIVAVRNTTSSGTYLNANLTVTAGTVTFNGNVGATDGNNIGVLTLNGSGTAMAVNGAGVIKAASVVLNSTSGKQTVSNVIADYANAAGAKVAASVTKTGSGETILTGDNTYTGATEVAEGLLKAGRVTNSFGSNSAVTVADGATLDLAGYSNTIGSLAGNGTVTNSGSAATLTTGGANADSTFDGVLVDDGTLALTKTGSGKQILTGANTYTGATTVSSGTLQVGNGGTTGSLASTTVITNDATLIFDRSDDLTINNAITGAGALTAKSGGDLTIGGNVSQDGRVTLIAGKDASVADDSVANGSVTGGDVTLNGNVSSTSDTVVIYSGNANTAAYQGKVAGSSSSTKKNYATASDGGTVDSSKKLNVFYRVSPSVKIVGIGADNKVYDASDRATLNTDGMTITGVIDGDTLSLSGTATGAFADKNVGTDKAVTVSGLSLSGTDAANYKLIEPSGLSADITQKDVTVSGLTAQDKVYDQTTVALLSGTAALTGGASSSSDNKVYTDDTVSLDGTATGAFADKNAGTDKAVTVSGLSLSGADAANYKLIEPSGLSADITQKDVTVSGLTVQNKVYDGKTTAILDTASATLEGKLPGDDLYVRSAKGTFDTAAIGKRKKVTVSEVMLGGGDAGNYSLPAGLSLELWGDINPSGNDLSAVPSDRGGAVLEESRAFAAKLLAQNQHARGGRAASAGRALPTICIQGGLYLPFGVATSVFTGVCGERSR